MPEDKKTPKRYKIQCGRCRLCLKFGILTREHVPPESAFNNRGYRQYYIEQLNEARHTRWSSKDVNANGIFVFSLCEECNNRTGRWYAFAYADFVQLFADFANGDNADSDIEVKFKRFHRVRVVKQVVSLFLSTSNPASFSRYKGIASPFPTVEPANIKTDIFGKPPDLKRLNEVYEGLRAFVQQRPAKGLPSGVRLYAYATANPGSGVQTGILGSAKLSTKKALWGAVVGLWPIHWVLAIEGEPDTQLLDVTDWANDDYKLKRNLKVRMPCRWTIARYPLDFRTPEKYMRDGFVTRMRLEGYIPESGADEGQIHQGAINFARHRGKRTISGVFLREFSTGTYAEYKGERWWFEEKSLSEVRAAFDERIAYERSQQGLASYDAV